MVRQRGYIDQPEGSRTAAGDSRIVRRANKGGKLIGRQEQESVSAITFQLMDSQAMSDIC